MNPRIRRKLAKQERRANRRLAKARKLRDSGRPVLRKTRARYEIAERTQAIAHGGIGVVHDLVLGSGLVEQLDERLNLLKVHRPYHESDHVPGWREGIGSASSRSRKALCPAYTHRTSLLAVRSPMRSSAADSATVMNSVMRPSGRGLPVVASGCGG